MAAAEKHRGAKEAPGKNHPRKTSPIEKNMTLIYRHLRPTRTRPTPATLFPRAPQQCYHHLRQSPSPFEPEGFCDHAHRQGAHLFRHLGHDRSRSRPRAAPHARRHEHHIRTGDHLRVDVIVAANKTNSEARREKGKIAADGGRGEGVRRKEASERVVMTASNG